MAMLELSMLDPAKVSARAPPPVFPVAVLATNEHSSMVRPQLAVEEEEAGEDEELEEVALLKLPQSQ